MGKKKKVKKKKIYYGTAAFYCSKCDYHFEVDWETIWAIQECTHGYVGYHLNDTFISCEKCNGVVNDETYSSPMDKKHYLDISDEDLPF